MDPKRLRRILDISKRVEKARKGELSAARHDALLSLQQLEASRREERERLRELAEAGELDVNALQDRALGLMDATVNVHKAKQHHAQVDAEVARREALVFESTRDVRKFEILSDRAKEEKRLALKNLEQQTLDETRRAPRKGNP